MSSETRSISERVRVDRKQWVEWSNFQVKKCRVYVLCFIVNNYLWAETETREAEDAKRVGLKI